MEYFQYLSLIFIEINLDRYFSNKQKLLDDLNGLKRTIFDADPLTFHDLSEMKMEDLNKLAFWSATGSGKTLLMQINILQFQHYLDKHCRSINRTLLITPNEGLTRQHLEEFEKSGIQAQVFNKYYASGLFGKQGIDVFEITKLADVDGEKTVA